MERQGRRASHSDPSVAGSTETMVLPVKLVDSQESWVSNIGDKLVMTKAEPVTMILDIDKPDVQHPCVIYLERQQDLPFPERKTLNALVARCDISRTLRRSGVCRTDIKVALEGNAESPHRTTCCLVHKLVLLITMDGDVYRKGILVSCVKISFPCCYKLIF